MLACVTCNQYYSKTYFNRFDNGVQCIYCNKIVYPCRSYMSSIYHIPNQFFTDKHMKFDEYESMIPSHKKIEFEIEKRERKMLLFAMETYYTSINHFGDTIIKYRHCCGKFKYNDKLKYHRIRIMHIEENNKLIKEYAHSSEPDDNIKQKLEDCYKKYCTMSDRLTHLINLIYGIIDKDISSSEKIADILGVDKILHSDINTFRKIVKNGGLHKIYVTERVLIACVEYICKHNYIDFIKYFTKNLIIIDKIVNGADLNLHNENEIKKSGIMNEIYDKLKECYNKVMFPKN